jgi:ribosomal-protein-alanine N-acetyltransferase
MDENENSNRSGIAQNFGDMVKAFTEAISQIFNDPSLKEKGKDFGQAAQKSAEIFAHRFKDEDVKDKWGDVAEAAKEFGQSVSDLFGSEKNNPTDQP